MIIFLINKWHSILDMPKKDFEWHKKKINNNIYDKIFKNFI
jgi:hypothetical protein